MMQVFKNIRRNNKDMYYKWTEGMHNLNHCFSKYANSDYIFSGKQILDHAYFCKYNIHGLLNKILPHIFNLTQKEVINFIVTNDNNVNRVFLEYINLLNIKNINIYKASEIRYVKTLIRIPPNVKLPSIRENKLYTKEWLYKLRNLTKTPKSIKKIVILRKDKHRKFQEDLLLFLLTEGFCPVVLDDMPIQEEIDLFAGVEQIVGNHGSGLSNAIFCQNNVKVLEITRGDYHYVYPDFFEYTNELLGEEHKIYHQQIYCDSDVDKSVSKTPYTDCSRFIKDYNMFFNKL